MPFLLTYLLKLSLSLGIVFLFYQFLLRRLTFYNWNRWYLLGYTLLCFFIPFINISSFVEAGPSNNNAIINFIPSIETYTGKVEGSWPNAANMALPVWDKWDWTVFTFLAGTGILLFRFVIRFISFTRMKRNA